MNKGCSRRRGFSLIEAVVSALLLVIGISSALRGMGSLATIESRTRESEIEHRLAVAKLEELIATGQASTANTNLSGDFNDQNEDRFTWQAQMSTTDTDTVQALTVTVIRVNSDRGSKTSVSTLVYQQPAANTPAGGG